MSNVKCAASEILKSYLDIRDWYRDYNRALDFWEELLGVLDGRTKGAYQSVQFVMDSYDVIHFCFPLYEAFKTASNDLNDEAYRKQLFQLLAARACLLYGVPFGRPVLLLQPHYIETLRFVDVVQQSASIAAAQKGLIRWAGPDLELPAILEVLELLDTTTPRTQLDPAKMEALKRLCRDFPDVALLLAGAHKNGIRTLGQLVRHGAFVEEPQWLPRQTFFGKCAKDLEAKIAQRADLESKGELPPILGDYMAWLEILDEERSSAYSGRPNENDAKALAMVREANRQFEEEKVLFLFVSGTEEISYLTTEYAEKLGEADRASASFNHLLVPMNYFYTYLQFGSTVASPPNFSDAPAKETLTAEARNALQDEKTTLGSFSELDKTMSSVLTHCRAAEPKEELACIDTCPLRRDEKRPQIRAALDQIARIRERTEDARVLEDRHPILRPYLDGIDKGGKAEITQILEHLQGGDPWRALLQMRIQDLKDDFSGVVGGLHGDIIPFLEKLSDTYAATFFYFPYRVKFQTQHLRKIAARLTKCARKGEISRIQSVLKEFSLAAADPKAKKEVDLVRAVCLYAFSKWQDIVALANSYMGGEDSDPGIAHELRYMRARARIEMYLSVPRNRRDPQLLIEGRKDCKQGRESKPTDARFLTALGFTLLHLHFEKAIPKDQRPTLTDVQEAHERALKIEEEACAKEPGRDKDLLWMSRNNLADILVRQGAEFLDRAEEQMAQIDVSREEWLAPWIDTLGEIAFGKAKASSTFEEQLAFAKKAEILFSEALGKAYSENIKRDIKRNLNRARNFLRQLEKGRE